MSNEQYDATILELVQLITSASVSQMGKAKFFGYTLDHMIHHYVQIQEGRSDRFNADLFPTGTRNSLTVTDFGGLDVGIPQAMRRSIDFAANSRGTGAG